VRQCQRFLRFNKMASVRDGEYDRGFWVKGDTVAYAGIKVSNIGGEAINRPFSHTPDTEGIEITITDAEHAKLPSTLHIILSDGVATVRPDPWQGILSVITNIFMLRCDRTPVMLT
jgi:hypothetical protein